MFEYINPGFYILSGILIVGSLGTLVLTEKKERKFTKSTFPIFVIFIAIAIPLGLSYQSKMKIKENIQFFSQNLPLECTDGFKTYIVSESRAWEIVKKDSFTKNDLIIRADSCSLNKEIKK